MKFRPVPLDDEYGHRRLDGGPWESATAAAVAQLVGGYQTFWGIPFHFGPEEPELRSLLVVDSSRAPAPVELSLDGLASHVVIAHFCDSRSASGVGGQSSDYANPAVTAPGEHLADYVLLYQDGTTAAIPVRRRFEVNQISTFLQNAFVARQQHEPRALDLHGPYDADLWGRTQMGVVVGGLARWSVAPHWLGDDLSPRASWSIYAMPNPHRGRAIAGLRIVSTGVASIGIGAITLFYGVGHPLRHLPLESVSVELSDGVLTDDDAARSQIDLGVIARRYRQPVFDASAWLRAPVRGWGEKWESCSTERSGLVLDLSGAEDAALTVAGREVALADLYGSGEASSTDGRLTARLIMPDKAWMEVTVIDKATGKPTPSRVHFRAPDGHYLPPAGHRQEVNDNWFEDYGADLKLGQTQYAYVGGQFQIQLPEGEVFVEVSKGFEFEPLRTRLNLSRGQREVRIELDRIADSRQEGWITADTHVHFLSPETARLEAQAEGLNIVNLLAAQWGDLYTNVGDLTGAQSGVSVDETIVWVGTENRQHFLGHISMLGVQGNPVLPLSTSGPPEGYIGEPTLRAMGEWADECRSKSGLVIAPHFPLPHSEITAEIVRGRVDAVELRDWHGSTMSTFGVDEWYRHLNAGYRVAAVGGTDKMSAGMPVGGVRTYANIGEQPFSYEAWKAAVRAGRTYTTSGPLLTFVVEGQGIGDEIRLPASGGKLEAVATALSIAPIHRLEIVYNGRVVADTSEVEGSHSLRLDAAVDIDQSGWLAARCISGHKAWHVWPIAFGAHTSPVYVVVGDAEVFDREVGQYLITMMEGGLSWLDTLATRGDPARHAAVRSVFTDGIERVRARLHEHPHHHLPPRDRLD